MFVSTGGSTLKSMAPSVNRPALPERESPGGSMWHNIDRRRECTTTRAQSASSERRRHAIKELMQPSETLKVSRRVRVRGGGGKKGAAKTALMSPVAAERRQ